MSIGWILFYQGAEVNRGSVNENLSAFDDKVALLSLTFEGEYLRFVFPEMSYLDASNDLP